MRRGYSLVELVVAVVLGLFSIVALAFGIKMLWKLWFLLDRI